nr:11481_t:CDS:2 [Entrophospora candida]
MIYPIQWKLEYPTYSRFKSDQRSMTLGDYESAKTNLLTLVDEVLVEICEYLLPSDLYTLSTVCKKLRKFLWSNSPYTQQIWRNSRIKHCDKQMQVDRPPPPNVSEQQYIWLSILATKCYFCDAEVKNNEALRWEFKILICESCLVEKTISFEDLKKTDRYPDEMFRCLPYVEHIKHPSINQSFLPPRLTFTDINVDNDSKDAANNSDIFINENSYFLEKDVNKFLEEYNNFTVSLLRDECIEEKKKSLREYMKAIQERKKEEARKLTKEIVFYHIGRMGGRLQ